MNIKSKDKTPKWPSTSHFDFKTDLVKENPETVDITLRVRLMKAIENGIAAEIGYVAGSHGRPRKIYALTPVTSDILDKAESNGITLIEKAREKFISVSMHTSSNTSPVVVTAPTSITA